MFGVGHRFLMFYFGFVFSISDFGFVFWVLNLGTWIFNFGLGFWFYPLPYLDGLLPKWRAFFLTMVFWEATAVETNVLTLLSDWLACVRTHVFPGYGHDQCTAGDDSKTQHPFPTRKAPMGTPSAKESLFCHGNVQTMTSMFRTLYVLRTMATQNEIYDKWSERNVAVGICETFSQLFLDNFSWRPFSSLWFCLFPDLKYI